MKILDQSKEGAVVKVRVEIPEEDLLPHFDKAYKKVQKNLAVDGFRKGKVPMSVVQKRYGESIRWESIDDYIKEIYPEILKKAELRPVTPGDIQEPDYQPGEKLSFTMVVEVLDEFSVDNWKGHSVLKEVAEVNDDDINEYLESMRRDKAIISVRDENSGAEIGDRMTIDLQELDSAGTIVIGHKNENVPIELGKEMLGEGTDEQVVGVKKDEVRRIKAQRTTTDADQKQKVEDFGWEITVKNLEQVELPELNDDFASQVDEKMEKLDDLREKIKIDLEGYTNYMVNQRVAERMIDKIVEANPFDVPPSLIAETLERLVQRQKEENQNMISEDVLRKSLESVAEKQIRWSFIKERLIVDLKLDATDEEIEKQLEMRGEATGQDVENLKMMFKSGEKRDMLQREITESKLMETLLKESKLDERKMPVREILNG